MPENVSVPPKAGVRKVESQPRPKSVEASSTAVFKTSPYSLIISLLPDYNQIKLITYSLGAYLRRLHLKILGIELIEAPVLTSQTRFGKKATGTSRPDLLKMPIRG
jgi:hypothetical protein